MGLSLWRVLCTIMFIKQSHSHSQIWPLMCSFFSSPHPFKVFHLTVSNLICSTFCLGFHLKDFTISEFVHTSLSLSHFIFTPSFPHVQYVPNTITTQETFKQENAIDWTEFLFKSNLVLLPGFHVLISFYLSYSVDLALLCFFFYWEETG